jgi:hypothetical protein
VAYVLPRIDCPWGGAYYPPGVWMLGRITRDLLAHELGHNYGVTEEGPAWACETGRCEVRSYGSPYSVMGHGSGHFNAYEKYTFGWIDRAGPGLRDGETTIARIDLPSARPHALYVLAGAEEYWIEYRPEAAGAVVHAGPSLLDPAARSRFPQRNLLLAGGGQGFSVPGAFAVAVATADGETARLAFRWTDRTPPARPQLSLTRRGRTLELRFPSADRGSGVAAYDVSLDGRRRARVETVQALGRLLGGRDPELELRLGRGVHRVSVVAFDRAGNRSVPAMRRVRIP